MDRHVDHGWLTAFALSSSRNDRPRPVGDPKDAQPGMDLADLLTRVVTMGRPSPTVPGVRPDGVLPV